MLRLRLPRARHHRLSRSARSALPALMTTGNLARVAVNVRPRSLALIDTGSLARSLRLTAPRGRVRGSSALPWEDGVRDPCTPRSTWRSLRIPTSSRLPLAPPRTAPCVVGLLGAMGLESYTATSAVLRPSPCVLASGRSHLAPLTPPDGRPPLSGERTNRHWRSCAHPSASGRPWRTEDDRRSSARLDNSCASLAAQGINL